MERVCAFMKSRADFILRAIAGAEERKQKEKIPPTPKSPTEGAPILLMGRTYSLHISVGAKRELRIEGDCLLLYRREGDGDAACKKLFRDFCLALLREEVERAVALYAPTFVGTQAKKLNTVSYRLMRSAWGTCRKTSGLITINTQLIYAPRAAIEYVVLHEMTHLLYPDHSKKFYAELAARMPDHKERRALLRGIDTRAEGLL